VRDERGGRVGADRGGAALGPVGEVGRDHELAAPADLHPDDALIPPRDHLAGAELKVEWLASVPGGVELLPRVVVDADVLDADLVPGGGLGAVALFDFLDLKLVGR